MSAFSELHDEKFIPVVIEDKKDVYPASEKVLQENDDTGRIGVSGN